MGEIKGRAPVYMALGLIVSVLMAGRAQAQLFYQQPSNYNSYLCGYGSGANGAGEISRTQFDSLLSSTLEQGGASDIQDADFFFQECFGGGMLTGLNTTMGTTPWVGASASSWWQVALATPAPARGVQPQYATWSAALVPQLNNNPNQRILTSDANAAAGDFFGPNSSFYRETPNYTSFNGGNALTLADPTAISHYAVIFVGDTGIYGSAGDNRKLGQSMRNVTADLLKTLSTAWFNTNFHIYLCFGDGTSATLGNNTASAIGANTGLNIAATVAANPTVYNTSILPGTYAGLQAAMGAIAVQPNLGNSQFLFYGFDHGDIHNNFYVNPVNHSIPLTKPLVGTGGSVTSSFSLEDPNGADPNPNPNGEVTDTNNEDDSADPPVLDLTYDGLDALASGTVDVSVNGFDIGSLDPTSSSTSLDIPLSDLEDNNTVLITNSTNENVNIDTETFDAGALPPEDDSAEVPEPACAAFGIVAVGLLVRRPRRAIRV